jgi:hypothetical protein
VRPDEFDVAAIAQAEPLDIAALNSHPLRLDQQSAHALASHVYKIVSAASHFLVHFLYPAGHCKTETCGHVFGRVALTVHFTFRLGVASVAQSNQVARYRE